MTTSSEENLPAALARHQIELPPPQVALLSRYCELLWDWNAKINLTRHTDHEKFVARDLIDSLAFSRFLQPPRKSSSTWAQAAACRAIVLAIVREDLEISLSESVAKKARVLADIVEQLGLKTPVLHARAEDILTQQRFDALTVRAVAKLKKLLEWFRPHWNAFDRLLVLKGPTWLAERGEARHYGLFRDLALRKLASYPLPGTESESVLLQITSFRKQYPRTLDLER